MDVIPDQLGRELWGGGGAGTVCIYICIYIYIHSINMYIICISVCVLLPEAGNPGFAFTLEKHSDCSGGPALCITFACKNRASGLGGEACFFGFRLEALGV